VLRQIFAVLLLCTVACAQSSAPERRVKGNIITSERDPAVRIQLPRSVEYLGADRWVLYDVADCELHAWVEADPQRNVRKLYWVQFEGYVPTRPELKHTYDSPRHATLGGMDFYVDTWVRARDAETKHGSDREHIEALIQAKRYKMPEGMMYVRLVHLLDEQKRKELMIIYGEDLAPSGFTAPELDTNGKAHDRWAVLDQGLVERAKKLVSVQPLKP